MNISNHLPLVVVALALWGSVGCAVPGTFGGRSAGADEIESSDGPTSGVELVMLAGQTDFGDVLVGDSTGPLTVSVSNNHESKTATVTGITIASPFRVEANPVMGEIGPGERLLVHVQFNPIASGPAGAQLRVAVAYGQDGVLWLSGTGIDSDPEGTMQAVVDVVLSKPGDDAEESGIGGPTYLNSSDLELIRDDAGPGDQMVGLRFAIPAHPGAAITRAWIQFQTDEVSSEATTLTIFAEASDDAAPFTAAASNLSTRPLTSASVTWRPAAWSVAGEAGPDQRSPNLAPLLDELVHRAGWSAGHHIAFIIVGSGSRVAVSFEGDPQGAARLHLESHGEFSSECGNGVVEGDEACDGGDCCDAQCEFFVEGITCRAATGECDSVETCSGNSAGCPTDEHLPDGATCTAGTLTSGNWLRIPMNFI